MVNLVTFYALGVNVDADATATATKSTDAVQTKESDNAENAIDEELLKASELVLSSVKSRKKVTVLCRTQNQAEAFDDLLWSYPADQFVPHNLYGEGPDIGTSVEIIWLGVYQKMTKLRNTAIVINLSQSLLENRQNIAQIIEFVPNEETQKAKARERYKQYKHAGCRLEYKNA